MYRESGKGAKSLYQVTVRGNVFVDENPSVPVGPTVSPISVSILTRQESLSFTCIE